MVDTEVTEFLDGRGVDYRVLAHEDDAFTSREAAALRDVPLEEMVKAMVFLDDSRKIVIAAVTADRKVDLASLKEAASIESLKFADESDIVEELGYEVGAIPPFVPGRNVPIFVDGEILRNETVNFSSGMPDAGIEVERDVFVEILDSFPVDVVEISSDLEQ